MELTLKIADGDGNVRTQSAGTNEVFLVCRKHYSGGDRIVIESSEDGHLVLALDDAIGSTVIYMKGKSYVFPVPFGDKRIAYSPRAFAGELHRLHVRKARPEEVEARRNLALNPWDNYANATIFPHAKANVETRDEAIFAARNAIDGEKANDGHSFWPYTSWGINRDPEAALTVDFGRPVRIDEVVFYLRADFPHDAWWEKASVTFSDGGTLDFPLFKSGAAQNFAFDARVVEWIKLHRLIKADDPSPYPALTQIEVWGQDIVGDTAAAK